VGKAKRAHHFVNAVLVMVGTLTLCPPYKRDPIFLKQFNEKTRSGESLLICRNRVKPQN
jgi:hypothetical protein